MNHLLHMNCALGWINIKTHLEKERLRQRRANERYGRPMSFLYLEYGKGYAFKGDNSGFVEERK